MVSSTPPRHPPEPLAPVRLEVMRMRWERLAYLHWPYEPAVVQALLPDGLTAEPWDDGAVWVGLIPFDMTVLLPGGIGIPRRLGRFAETNVRTYVTDADGRPGVWFFSLEAGGLVATTLARVGYGLPYFWADMTIGCRSDPAGDHWRYTSTRRWPGPRGASTTIEVRVGDPIPAADASPFEHYLSARWGLYSRLFGRTLAAPVSHPQWPLHRAEVLDLDDELVTAAGLPAPTGDPVAHWSPGTEVRIGLPRPATRRRR